MLIQGTHAPLPSDPPQTRTMLRIAESGAGRVLVLRRRLSGSGVPCNSPAGPGGVAGDDMDLYYLFLADKVDLFTITFE